MLGQTQRTLPIVISWLFYCHFVQVEEQLEISFRKLVFEGLGVQLGVGEAVES
jgi:hypothetical protein